MLLKVSKRKGWGRFEPWRYQLNEGIGGLGFGHVDIHGYPTGLLFDSTYFRFGALTNLPNLFLCITVG